MYISKVVFSKDAKRLYDPRACHQFVCGAFGITHTNRDEMDSSALLYRMERNFLLAQSRVEPDWSRTDLSLVQSVAIKQFTPVFMEGGFYEFTFTGNPVKRLRSTEDGPAKLAGLYSDPDRFDWLQRKGDLHGFTPLTASILRVNDHRNAPGEFAIHLVTFTGSLRVDDADLFSQAFVTGVGRGKAYGAGLISLAPAN